MVKALLRSKLFKNSFVYVFAEALNKAIPFFVLPILTTYLSKEQFGVVSNFQVLANILIVCVGLATSSAVTVNYHRLETAEIRDYISNIVLILLFSLVAFLFFIFIGGSYIADFIGVTKNWIYLGVIFAGCQFLNTLIVRIYTLRQDAMKVALFQVSKSIVNVSLTLIFVISLQMTWEGRVLGIAGAGISFSIISLFLLYKFNYLKPIFKKEYFTDALKIGLPLIPHQLSHLIKNGVDRFIVTSLIGLEANGVYSLAYQLGSVLLIVFTAVNQALTPHLFKELKTANNASKKRMVKLLYGIALLIFILVLLGSVIVPIGFELFIPNRDYDEAVGLIPLFFIAFGFKGLYFLVFPFLLYEKHTKLIATITFSISIIHLGLSYFLTEKFGLTGACLALVISECITFLVVAYFSNKRFPMPWLTFLSKK